MNETASLVLKVDASQATTATGELEKLSTSAGKAESSSGKLAGAAKAVGAALAIAAAAGAAMVKQQIDVADDTMKGAQSAGLATEQYSRLAYAMSLGVKGGGDLSTSMKFLNSAIADADAGAEKQASTFNQLGVEYRNADGTLRNSRDVMLDVAESFSKLEDGAGKASMAQDLFGKSGETMIPFLNQGRDGIEALERQADALGVTISGGTAKAAEQFNDNLTVLGGVTQGLANQVMKEMLPSLNGLSASFIDAATTGGTMQSVASGIGAVLKGIITAAVGVVAVLQNVGNAIGGIAAAAVSALSGDFKGAASILKDTYSDSVDGVAAAMERMSLIWATTTDEAAAADVKRAASFINANSAINKAADEKEQKDKESHEAELQRMAEIEWRNNEMTKKAAERMEQNIAAEKARDEAKLLSIQEQFMAEDELEKLRYEKKLADLQFYIEQKGLIESEAMALESQLREEHERKLQEIQQKSSQANFLSVASSIGQIAGAFAGHSKKMFKLMKIAGIAQGLVSIQTGIANALALPWPLNLGAAASVATAGAGVIANLRSISESGSGSTGGRFSASAGAAPDTSGIMQQAQQQRAQVVDFRVQSRGRRGWDDEDVADLMAVMGERLKDGAKFGNVEFMTA